MTLVNDIPGTTDLADKLPRRLLAQASACLPGGAAAGAYYFDAGGVAVPSGTSGRCDCLIVPNDGNLGLTLPGKTTQWTLDYSAYLNANAPQVNGNLKVQLAGALSGGNTGGNVQLTRSTVSLETGPTLITSPSQIVGPDAVSGTGLSFLNPSTFWIDWAGTLGATGAILVTARLYVAYV